MSQVLKLKKGSVAGGFMNKDILFVDVKSVRLDRVLTNLFLKMYANGAPLSPLIRRGGYDIENIEEILCKLEEKGKNMHKVKFVIPRAISPENWASKDCLKLKILKNLGKKGRESGLQDLPKIEDPEEFR